MALDDLFCKDLIVSVENSPVRTFTLFPKHVTFTPRYGHLVLENTLNVFSTGYKKFSSSRDILFCNDLMVNEENSLERTSTLFPKHVTFTPRYGQLDLGMTSGHDIRISKIHGVLNFTNT